MRLGDFIEEDVVLEGRAGVGVELGLFGQENLQADGDPVLVRRTQQQCKRGHICGCFPLGLERGAALALHATLNHERILRRSWAATESVFQFLNMEVIINPKLEASFSLFFCFFSKAVQLQTQFQHGLRLKCTYKSKSCKKKEVFCY